MRLLADTNLFVKFCHRQPLPRAAETALENLDTLRHLSPVSVIEIFWLWQRKRILINPDEWLDQALVSWIILPVTFPVARQSALWDWPHRDPADRLLAATAQVEKIEFLHTDTRLKGFTGFPQRYFSNVR